MAACWLVRAVPQGARPACRPGSAMVTAMASNGPSTMTGTRRGRGVAGLVQAEQQVAFLVAAGLGAVEVFRDVRAGTGAGAADEPGECAALVVDREHDPVPEVVDERSAGGEAGEPGGLDRVVVVAEAAQVVGERGPLRRGRIRCASPVWRRRLMPRACEVVRVPSCRRAGWCRTACASARTRMMRGSGIRRCGGAVSWGAAGCGVRRGVPSSCSGAGRGGRRLPAR